MFASFRSKLQAAFVLLGLVAIGITGWQASSGATEALAQATYDRLNAIRQTRGRQLERYFANVANHVAALSTDDATLTALEGMEAAWERVPEAGPDSAGERAMRAYYRQLGVPEGETDWVPADPRTVTLQYSYLAGNPHPPGAKDLLVSAEAEGVVGAGSGIGPYDELHARFHPTLHRYNTAFGFYDIFLISAPEGRILYTVMKEIDLGAVLTEPPYGNTGLAQAYRDALDLSVGQDAVTQDFAPYVASGFAPAAFVAAPIRRAGEVAGVLAIQVSIDEVNQVMNGGQRWREEGFGETGQSYLVGPDNTLRSDLRVDLENPELYYTQLSDAGVNQETVARIRQQGTAVLAYTVDLNVVERVRDGEQGAEIGTGISGQPVLRSHGPLNVNGLDWAVIAEIETQEAFQPVRALQGRILGVGVLVSLVFFLVATSIAVSVTRPVLQLAALARKIGKGNLDIQIPVQLAGPSGEPDEIGQLADDFNRMVRDLKATTVSKRELEILAGRLITAQEDERARLARELHDDLTQRLAAVAIDAGNLARKREALALSEEQLQNGLDRIKVQMASLSDDIHGLSRRLHPAMLEELGLEAAIEAECRAFMERGGPPVETRFEGDLKQLPREVRITLFRIVQEALRNIQRHAGASEVELAINRTASGITLRMQDDGRGFDRTSKDWQPGLGLASMEERVRLVKGSFQVDSTVGQGTVVNVLVPLHDAENTTSMSNPR